MTRTRYLPPEFKTVQLFAVSTCGLIGRNGTLPWDYPEDLKFFKDTTSEENSAVIMGYKTWESLPVDKISGEKLPGRKKLVYTRKKDLSLLKDTIFVDTLAPVSLRKILSPMGIYKLFYIGGKTVIEASRIYVKDALVTVIDDHYSSLSEDVRIDKSYIKDIISYGDLIRKSEDGKLWFISYNSTVADTRRIKDRMLKAYTSVGTISPTTVWL